MSISRAFIRRPIATSLLMLGVLLSGLAAYRELPVSALPEVDYPTIVVSASLPGAGPETMAQLVTTPLERQFGQMPSLAHMTSVSSLSTAQITLQFDLDRPIDAAEQDVQAAMNAASTLLPRLLPTPPTYSKSNPADSPILTLAIHSDSLPLNKVHDYVDSVLAQRISQVAGVGLVAISGGQKPAVRVQVDPTVLTGVGLSLEDVRQALVQANVNQPKGIIDGKRQSFTIAANDQLGDAASFRPVVLAYKQGSPIRLRDVADVIDDVENVQLAGWASQKRAILLSVSRQPGANVIQVADRVQALLPQLRAALPAGVDVSTLSDRTQTVRASVADVQETLILSVVLVIGVIYLFLRSPWAMVIAGLTVPLSLLATFGVMYLLGYSLNNLSLMALTISTGFVIDDSIVMIENVNRYVEDGEHPYSAALKGAKQIEFTIISLTVSLVAVLIPFLFMKGIIGRLFREFAVTLSISIAVSAVLSLTLTATLCAHRLRGYGGFALPGVLEHSWETLLAAYDRCLRVVFRHRRLTLAATILTVLLTAYLAVIIPKGLLPLQDTGLILGVFETAPSASFASLLQGQRDLSAVLLADPDVESVASAVGVDGINLTQNSGRMSVTLKPRHTRQSNAEQIIARLRPQLAKLSSATLHLQAVQDLQLDSRVTRTQFQFTLEDTDPDELRASGERVLDRLRSVPEICDVASDQQEGGLGLDLTIDRDSAARMGVRPQAIDEALYDAFGQRPITTVFTQLNQYRVILELKPQFQKTPDTLRHVYVRSQQGDPVPLLSLVHPTQGRAALSVNHQGQFAATTLSFNTSPGVSLGNAVDAVQRAVHDLRLPPRLRAGFQGTALEFQRSLARELALVVAALLTVYIVLGVLYESYIHPITILSTLPSAGVGALLALILCRTEFSLIALIGLVLLIGIVKKNAIMMIDFALKAEREQGIGTEESIYKACLIRFRPIMMTTLAALLAGLPLMLGAGVGSELRRPLGITIVGGLLVSQVLTLFTTPIIYLYMAELSVWLRKGGSRTEP